MKRRANIDYRSVDVRFLSFMFSAVCTVAQGPSRSRRWEKVRIQLYFNWSVFGLICQVRKADVPLLQSFSCVTNSTRSSFRFSMTQAASSSPVQASFPFLLCSIKLVSASSKLITCSRFKWRAKHFEKVGKSRTFSKRNTKFFGLLIMKQPNKKQFTKIWNTLKLFLLCDQSFHLIWSPLETSSFERRREKRGFQYRKAVFDLH